MQEKNILLMQCPAKSPLSITLSICHKSCQNLNEYINMYGTKGDITFMFIEEEFMSVHKCAKFISGFTHHEVISLLYI